MSDVFVSYAKEDRERAKVLAEALASTGWSVFWDREIPGGMTWRQFIREKLDNTRCLLIAWSK